MNLCLLSSSISTFKALEYIFQHKQMTEQLNIQAQEKKGISTGTLIGMKI